MSAIVLPISFAVVALLYSAVGQAGGTGYIAVMGLLGYGPEIVKPTALALNILVAFIACVHFYRAGLLTWRSCYPFGILGAPFSLLGGAINLPAAVYQPFVGCCCSSRLGRCSAPQEVTAKVSRETHRFFCH